MKEKERGSGKLGQIKCYLMHGSGLSIQLGCRLSCEHLVQATDSFRVFPTGGWGSPSHQPNVCSSPHQTPPPPSPFPHRQKFILPTKQFIFSYNHCSCTIFILTLNYLYIEVVLILILIDVQYLQNVVFRFKKGLNGQNHSLSDSHHPIKKYPPAGKFLILSYPLMLFGKPRIFRWD